MSFTEIENFGLNWLTASFIVLTILNVWQFFAYTKQGIAIIEEKSASAVSLVFAVVVPGLLAGVLWYGMIEQSIVLIAAGICFLPATIVAIGALIYGNPSHRDWLIFWMASIMPFGFLLPVSPDAVFVLLAVAVVVPLGYQLLTLYRTGHRGVSKGELLLTYLVKNFSYMIFGFAIENQTVGFSGVGWFLLALWLYWKWYSLPKQNPATT